MVTDFDGTLAPIVADPGQAAPLAGSAGRLERLAARYGRVAVVSGRPVHYLLDHLGAVRGVELVGLYGLERARDGKVVALDAAARWRPAVAAAAAAARAAAPPGVRVEDKGLALTLHVRGAEHLAGWLQSFAAEESGRSGLQVHPAKRSLELRPPLDVDKGTVVATLAEGLRALCYAGDDAGDLPAFDRLASLRRTGLATLAVAAASSEAPPDLLAAADLVVDGPDGVAAVLDALLADG